MDTAELPVNPDPKWVNMNKVEYDKLAWTKELPTPETGDKATGKPVRFDFEGMIVAGDGADLPTHLGLHHHGEEPEVGRF